MFIAEAHPPENQAPSGAACRIGDQTNGSMPLLTELGADRCWFGVPINMPLLRSLADRAARVAINMPLLTELSGAARRP